MGENDRPEAPKTKLEAVLARISEGLEAIHEFVDEQKPLAKLALTILTQLAKIAFKFAKTSAEDKKTFNTIVGAADAVNDLL